MARLSVLRAVALVACAAAAGSCYQSNEGCGPETVCETTNLAAFCAATGACTLHDATVTPPGSESPAFDASYSLPPALTRTSIVVPVAMLRAELATMPLLLVHAAAPRGVVEVDGALADCEAKPVEGEGTSLTCTIPSDAAVLEVRFPLGALGGEVDLTLRESVCTGVETVCPSG
jgi:hypothetical protein